MSVETVKVLNGMCEERERVRTSLAMRMQYIRSVSVTEMEIMVKSHCDHNQIELDQNTICSIAQFTVDKHMSSLASIIFSDKDMSG